MAKRKQSPLVDVHDWLIAGGIGVILGMLIVGLPQLIGGVILISILAISLKLVELGRL